MTVKSDELGRLSCSDLIPPNSVFDAQKQEDGSIRLQQISKNEVPVVELVRSPEGFLMLPVRLDGKAIKAAIRADRDAK